MELRKPHEERLADPHRRICGPGLCTKSLPGWVKWRICPVCAIRKAASTSTMD